MREELGRARQIASELGTINDRLRSELAMHEGQLTEFRRDVRDMESGAAPANWRRLSSKADHMIGPTMRLATNLMQAHDQLHQFHSQLLTFAGTRIDPSTGLQNRRAMEEHLEAQLSLHGEPARRFSLAVFSVTAARRGEVFSGEGRLRAVAHLIQDCVRGSDLVARYSDDEFVVLMPQTPLAGGMVFCERLLKRALADLGCPLWGGLVEAKRNESAEKLLSRADSALYSARTQHGPCLFHHNGVTPQRHTFKIEATPESSATGPVATSVSTVPGVCARIG
jgi:GGDEF domain-containing protein